MVLVGYPAQVDACMHGSDGILAGLRKDAVVVISSTTEPLQVQELAATARECGGDVLDAPIARGEPAARIGDVLWFVGGEPLTLERARDALAINGPDIHHVGGVGAGQVAKSINNMLLRAAVVSNREALLLAKAFGVDEHRLRTALLDSSAASWAMAHWDMMEHSPWAHKDMALTTSMGDQAGLSLPLAGLLREAVKDKWFERDVELPPSGAALDVQPRSAFLQRRHNCVSVGQS